MNLGKFLAGVTIGAIAGVLLAPKKGSEMREDLKEKCEKMKGLTKEDVEAILGETIEKMKKSADEFDRDAFKDSTKEKIEELQKNAEDLLEKVKDSDSYDKVAAGVAKVIDQLNALLDNLKKQDDQGIVPDSHVDEQIDEVEDELDEIINEFDK